MDNDETELERHYVNRDAYYSRSEAYYTRNKWDIFVL